VALSPSDLTAAVASAAATTRGLRVAFLFGSQVTGRTWAESDVDVALRWDPGLDLDSRVQAERAFVAQLGERATGLAAPVDLVDLDSAASGVAFHAIKDGICAWSRSDAERVEAVVRVARRYDDEAPMRALFRRAAHAAVDRMPRDPHGR
jgi:predicted nucleotidyltransferase